ADCALVVGTTSKGHRQLAHPLRRLELGGKVVAKKLASSNVALLFGSGKFGLSNEDMSHCHWLTRIPSREEHGSMNLGQAVAICLYEIVREISRIDAGDSQRRKVIAPRQEEGAKAKAADIERLTQLLYEVLSACGY